MITLQFLITSLIIVLIPGTGVVLTISTGVTQGRRASVWAALGCTLGIVPHLLATIFGLATLMHTSALAFQTLKYAGVAYLLYLAWLTWRDTSAFAIEESTATISPKSLVIKGILLNILNPKLTLFFLAFLPQFISPNANAPLIQMLVLSAIFMLMTFVVFVIYGLLAHQFRVVVIESPTIQSWMRRGFAGAFTALGLNLAFSKD
jgi:threonine/homoserine/homoserine lactone efflux protein